MSKATVTPFVALDAGIWCTNIWECATACDIATAPQKLDLARQRPRCVLGVLGTASCSAIAALDGWLCTPLAKEKQDACACLVDTK